MSPAEKPAKKPAKKPAPAKPFRDDDGFLVEEDGLVEMMVELRFCEDAKIRVTPDVAKRLADGEFDNQDPMDIPGLDSLEVFDNVRVEIEQSYEARPLPPPKDESTDEVLQGSEDDDDGRSIK